MKSISKIYGVIKTRLVFFLYVIICLPVTAPIGFWLGVATGAVLIYLPATLLGFEALGISISWGITWVMMFGCIFVGGWIVYNDIYGKD